MKYMSDVKSEKIKSYIADMTKEIEDYEARKEVEEELISHIDEKLAVFLDMGYSEEEAVDKVTESMGACEETAQQLKALHPAKLPWVYDIILNLCTLLIPILGIMIWVSSIEDVPMQWIDDVGPIKISWLMPLALLAVNIHFSKVKKEKRPAWRILTCGVLELAGYIASRVYLWRLMSGLFPDSCTGMLDIEQVFIFRELDYIFAGSFIVTAVGLLAYQVLVLKGKNKKKPVIVSIAVAFAIVFASYSGFFSFGDEGECADIVKKTVVASCECAGDYSKCPENIKSVISDKELFWYLNFGLDSEDRKEYEKIYEDYHISNSVAVKIGNKMLVKYGYYYAAYESPAKTLGTLIKGAGSIYPPINVIVTLENKGDGWKITDKYERP